MDRFESIVKEFHPIIYKICRVYAPDFYFDDLYQEVLVNIWRSYNSFKGDSNLSTWVYRVALNTALTFQRNRKKYKNKVSLEQLHNIPDNEDITTDKEQEIQKLYAAISQLKPDDKAIILLYLEKKSYDEISEITGFSLSNVGVRINRIKKKIFKILKEETNG